MSEKIDSKYLQEKAREIKANDKENNYNPANNPFKNFHYNTYGGNNQELSTSNEEITKRIKRQNLAKKISAKISQLSKDLENPDKIEEIGTQIKDIHKQIVDNNLENLPEFYNELNEIYQEEAKNNIKTLQTAYNKLNEDHKEKAKKINDIKEQYDALYDFFGKKDNKSKKIAERAVKNYNNGEFRYNQNDINDKNQKIGYILTSEDDKKIFNDCDKLKEKLNENNINVNSNLYKDCAKLLLRVERKKRKIQSIILKTDIDKKIKELEEQNKELEKQIKIIKNGSLQDIENIKGKFLIDFKQKSNEINKRLDDLKKRFSVLNTELTEDERNLARNANIEKDVNKWNKDNREQLEKIQTNLKKQQKDINNEKNKIINEINAKINEREEELNKKISEFIIKNNITSDEDRKIARKMLKTATSFSEGLLLWKKTNVAFDKENKKVFDEQLFSNVKNFKKTHNDMQSARADVNNNLNRSVDWKEADKLKTIKRIIDDKESEDNSIDDKIINKSFDDIKEKKEENEIIAQKKENVSKRTDKGKRTDKSKKFIDNKKKERGEVEEDQHESKDNVSKRNNIKNKIKKKKKGTFSKNSQNEYNESSEKDSKSEEEKSVSDKEKSGIEYGKDKKYKESPKIMPKYEYKKQKEKYNDNSFTNDNNFSEKNDEDDISSKDNIMDRDKKNKKENIDDEFTVQEKYQQYPPINKKKEKDEEEAFIKALIKNDEKETDIKVKVGKKAGNDDEKKLKKQHWQTSDTGWTIFLTLFTGIGGIIYVIIKNISISSNNEEYEKQRKELNNNGAKYSKKKKGKEIE